MKKYQVHLHLGIKYIIILNLLQYLLNLYLEYNGIVNSGAN